VASLSKSVVYEKEIQRATDSPKRSLLHSRKPFLIRVSRFFILDTSIENLMPKPELQPMRIGYARVSTHDQNLEMQLDALKKAGCKRIFTDKLSGAQVARPGLNEALSQLRHADTLVVWKLDRLGRSVKGLVDLVNELETQKVHFQSITDGIDTKTPAGRFFFHVMASLAQMERELIMERTRAGLQAARRQGRVGVESAR
jgi:DNA invertase Pin-like site-specific DNA recombinase